MQQWREWIYKQDRETILEELSTCGVVFHVAHEHRLLHLQSNDWHELEDDREIDISSKRSKKINSEKINERRRNLSWLKIYYIMSEIKTSIFIEIFRCFDIIAGFPSDTREENRQTNDLNFHKKNLRIFHAKFYFEWLSKEY